MNATNAADRERKQRRQRKLVAEQLDPRDTGVGCELFTDLLTIGTPL